MNPDAANLIWVTNSISSLYVIRMEIGRFASSRAGSGSNQAGAVQGLGGQGVTVERL